MAEVLNETNSQIGSLADRLVKKLALDRLVPENVERIIISHGMWPELVTMSGELLAFRNSDIAGQMWFGDFKVEPGDIDEDFKIIMRKK